MQTYFDQTRRRRTKPLELSHTIDLRMQLRAEQASGTFRDSYLVAGPPDIVGNGLTPVVTVSIDSAPDLDGELSFELASGYAAIIGRSPIGRTRRVIARSRASSADDAESAAVTGAAEKPERLVFVLKDDIEYVVFLCEDANASASVKLVAPTNCTNTVPIRILKSNQYVVMSLVNCSGSASGKVPTLGPAIPYADTAPPIVAGAIDRAMMVAHSRWDTLPKQPK